MHYTVGTEDSSVRVPAPAVSSPSPSFSLPAAPPPPSSPIGSTSHTSRESPVRAVPTRQVQPSATSPARSTFPSPPSHPNPAFASTLKRDAASAERAALAEQDRSAHAASVAGPSTQPETAFAATSTLASSGASGPRPKAIRLDSLPGSAGASDSAGRIEEEEETGAQSLSVSERIKDTMAEHSAVISTFIAGGLAGAASRTVVSPLERLKIILQVQTAPQAAAGASTSGQAYGAMWPSLVRMWKEEGFRGFMKGNGINVVRILPYSAIQFTSYGYAKKLFARWSGQEQLSTPLRLAAGASAGILAVSATYPLDLVRARLSIATANMARSTGSKGFSAEDAKLGIVGMTKKVYRLEGGIKGLYRGCWATAVGVAPYVSLNFYIYETHYHPSTEIELVGRKLLSGAVAGGTSLLFTHPFDVVRRKLQVVGIGGGEREYTGAIDCIRKISAKEGFWKGMYRGLTPNIIKVAPSIAVSFYTFETVKEALTNLANGAEERLV